MTARAWRIARIALGCGALVLAPRIDAVSLGKAELRSRAGEPLEARIPLSTEPGETLRGACFSLLTAPKGPLAASGARLELRHHAHGADLFLRSRAPLSDPEVSFAIALSCTGALGAEPVRYSFALSAAAPASVASTPRPPERTAPALPVVARLPARSGDTLASIAHAIFPGDAGVRERYIAAMRRQNAALAAVGEDQPLPEGTAVALPDLHAFAATIPASHGPERTASASHAAPRFPAPAAPRLAQALSSPKIGEPSRATASRAIARRDAASASHAAAAAPARSNSPRAEDGFQLRLSAPVMDLSPSAGMDERRRAELRERLLVLDADDRTAAMLAMRENIRRLESQVSALKLKLATLETAPLAKPQAATPKPEAVAPKREAAAPSAGTAAPKPGTTASTSTPPPAAARSAPVPPKVVAAPKPPPPPRSSAPAAQAPIADTPEAKAQPSPARAPARSEPSRERPGPAAAPWYLNRLWLAALVTILIVAWIVLRARVRSAEEPEIIEPPTEIPETGAPDSAIPDTEAPRTTEPHEAAPGEAPVAVATRAPAEDRAELRRRYMEERFPEIVNGALVLEDERSVVKAARLLYEDGTAPRAIELLQFAIEQDPEALRPWLALFEIFRLEKLEGEFGHLAARFAERHGATDEWRKVRSVGRALDPANPLYQGTEYGAPADPEAEGWLRSASDDAGRALAGELRAKLLSEAGVAEADLRDDPTPALRKAEIFSLA